jgi:DNA-directed RNA polymerase specialized sigma24 family protein
LRFAPSPKPIARVHTRRRLLQAEKTIARQKAKYPMFADQFTSETPEECLNRLDEGAHAFVQQWRDHQAALWRRARRALFALPEPQRRALLDEWNDNRWLPGSPEYLLDFLGGRGLNCRL